MKEQAKKTFDLQERLIDFSVRVMVVTENLPSGRLGNHIAGQLIRSGTSPAPNYGEAQSAESRKDFIHKLKIALKELRETHVWLLMIQRKPLLDSPNRLSPLIDECNELIAIFVRSIQTTKDNLHKDKDN